MVTTEISLFSPLSRIKITWIYRFMRFNKIQYPTQQRQRTAQTQNYERVNNHQVQARLRFDWPQFFKNRPSIKPVHRTDVQIRHQQGLNNRADRSEKA